MNARPTAAASHPCPRCQAPAPLCAGGVLPDGTAAAIYQCETCVVGSCVLGVPCEVNLSFARREDGRIVDPTSGAPLADAPR